MSSCDWCTDSGASPAKIPTSNVELWLYARESVSMVPFRLKSTTYRVLRGPKEAIVWDPCLGCGSGVTWEHGALINPPTGCPVWKEPQKALLYEKHDSKEIKKRQCSLAFSLFLLSTCSPVYFKSSLKKKKSSLAPTNINPVTFNASTSLQFFFFYCKDSNSSSHYHFFCLLCSVCRISKHRSKWGISPFCFLSYLSTSNF